MNKVSDSRAFYEGLYSAKPPSNPAQNIYDGLRIGTIQELVKSHSGPVLIVGCGSKRDLEIIPLPEQVIAFDLSFHAVNSLDHSRARLFVGDATCIPLRSEQFGLIICSEVLEHIPAIDSAIREFRRLIKPGGLLVVSSPNWHSWFGLARWIGENFFHRSLHSNGQPFDDWKTPTVYARELSPGWRVVTRRGIWYLPPLHFGSVGLPSFLTRIIWRFYSPLEFILSRVLPGWGHLLIMKCIADAADV